TERRPRPCSTSARRRPRPAPRRPRLLQPSPPHAVRPKPWCAVPGAIPSPPPAAATPLPHGRLRPLQSRCALALRARRAILRVVRRLFHVLSVALAGAAL